VSIIYLSLKNPDHNNNGELSPGIHYGEVYGDFISEGALSSYEEYNTSRFLLWIYENNPNATFQLEIWNISMITIGDLSHGIVTYTNYTLNNESLIIDDPSGYFICKTRNAVADITYSEIGAENDDDYFYIYYHFASVQCNGTLEHQSGEYLDFQLMDPTVRIGNQTIDLNEARFGWPVNEVAKFELKARGYGKISPIPTIKINGSISVEDLKENYSNGNLYKEHEVFQLYGENITIITRKAPVIDYINHSRYVIVRPWTIEIMT
jgi:hypothetical protein